MLIGSVKKSAKPFTKDDEGLLWDARVLGVHSPESLFNTVFYYNGKECCLRGGEEHRSLKLSQFKKVPFGYIYTENGSKNHSGGLGNITTPNKHI